METTLRPAAVASIPAGGSTEGPRAGQVAGLFLWEKGPDPFFYSSLTITSASGRREVRAFSGSA